MKILNMMQSNAATIDEDDEEMFKVFRILILSVQQQKVFYFQVFVKRFCFGKHNYINENVSSHLVS